MAMIRRDYGVPMIQITTKKGQEIITDIANIVLDKMNDENNNDEATFFIEYGLGSCSHNAEITKGEYNSVKNILGFE